MHVHGLLLLIHLISLQNTSGDTKNTVYGRIGKALFSELYKADHVLLASRVKGKFEGYVTVLWALATAYSTLDCAIHTRNIRSASWHLEGGFVQRMEERGRERECARGRRRREPKKGIILPSFLPTTFLGVGRTRRLQLRSRSYGVRHCCVIRFW